MPKRKANGASIKAAFARQADRADAAAQTASWQPLEVLPEGWAGVPDDYWQEAAAKFADYLEKRADITKRADRSIPAADSDAAAAAAAYQTRVASWQASAAYCVQQLSLWSGSGIALHKAQQEALLHIVVNGDLHSDPLISAKAYDVLLQNLLHHPPAQLLVAEAKQAPVLQSAAGSDLCWGVFGHSSTPLLQEAPAPFPMLQALVSNAAQLVTGIRSSSSGGGSSSNSRARSQQGSQGQALLLLYVVQLLQADLLVRQAAFEAYMHLAQSLDGDAPSAEAQARAATVLQHSLLYRVVGNDSVAGDSWKFIPGSSKGKHQLVRDLLLLVSSTGHEDIAILAPATATTKAATTSAASPAVAAAAGGPSDASGTQPMVPVSSQELIQAARLLLLLLLQLYSSCEEAGVYGHGGEGRHHMQRLQGGAGQPNDRFELDDVLMTAIGSCGHISTYALPQLKQHSCLQRLLLALPPVHRVRLLALMVVSVIHNRVVDTESDGKLAETSYNLEAASLQEYLCSRGRGHTGFRQPSAVLIIEAIDARLDWAAKEMFGGKLLFALLVATLVSAAAGVMERAPAQEKPAFAAAARHILEHVLEKSRAIMAAEFGSGACCDALLALTAATQQMSSLAA